MALYEVEKGDSIWKIAEKSLAMQMPGQPLDPAQVAQEMQKIIGLNLKKLDDTPDLIHSGLVLDIGGSPTPGQAAEKGKNAKPSAYPDSEGVPPGGNIAGQEQRPQGGGGGGRNLTDERNERILGAGSEPESVPQLWGGARIPPGFQNPGPYGQSAENEGAGSYGNIAPGVRSGGRPPVGPPRAPSWGGGGGGYNRPFPPGSVFSGQPYDINGNLMGEPGYRPPRTTAGNRMRSAERTRRAE